MKNETISRIILVLEIAAIILFHSLKSNAPAAEKLAKDFHEQPTITLQQSSHLILTKAKSAANLPTNVR